jgi:hypothetical protein
MDHEFIWLPQGEKVPQSEQETIRSKRFTLTIVWNPHWFHLIDVPAKAGKFNAAYYVPEVLSVISKWRSTQANGHERKLIIHPDNARPDTARLSSQFCEQNKMKAAPLLRIRLLSHRSTFTYLVISRNVW